MWSIAGPVLHYYILDLRKLMTVKFKCSECGIGIHMILFDTSKHISRSSSEESKENEQARQHSRHTGCSGMTGKKYDIIALVVYHLGSYGISAFFTDNGTF